MVAAELGRRAQRRVIYIAGLLGWTEISNFSGAELRRFAFFVVFLLLYAQTPLGRSVVDLLCNLLYSRSAANQHSGPRGRVAA